LTDVTTDVGRILMLETTADNLWNVIKIGHLRIIVSLKVCISSNFEKGKKNFFKALIGKLISHYIIAQRTIRSEKAEIISRQGINNFNWQ
jgi:hypothetical protein